MTRPKSESRAQSDGDTADVLVVDSPLDRWIEADETHTLDDRDDATVEIAAVRSID